MFKVIRHGNSHYRIECENCSCIFEYDKTDIRGYIENDGRVFKIRCPECGTVIEIEGENDAGN